MGFYMYKQVRNNKLCNSDFKKRSVLHQFKQDSLNSSRPLLIIRNICLQSSRETFLIDSLPKTTLWQPDSCIIWPRWGGTVPRGCFVSLLHLSHGRKMEVRKPRGTITSLEFFFFHLTTTSEIDLYLNIYIHFFCLCFIKILTGFQELCTNAFLILYFFPFLIFPFSSSFPQTRLRCI